MRDSCFWHGRSQAGLDTSDQFRLDAMMVDAWSASHNILMWSDAALDKSDWGFEAGLGYQFSPYLAFEGAYLDSGGLTRETPLTVSNTGTLAT